MTHTEVKPMKRRKITSIWLSAEDRERLERLGVHLKTKTMAGTIRLAIQAYLSLNESLPTTQHDNHVHH